MKTFDPFKSCKNCPYRCADPNCHNEQICKGWAHRQYIKSQQKAQLEKDRDVDNYIKDKMVMNRIAYHRSLQKGQRHKKR